MKEFIVDADFRFVNELIPIFVKPIINDSLRFRLDFVTGLSAYQGGPASSPSLTRRHYCGLVGSTI